MREAITATYWAPPRLPPAPKLIVLAQPDGTAANSGESAPPTGLLLALLQRGFAVLEARPLAAGPPHDQFANFYTTYNRTKVQKCVADLLTLCSSAQAAEPKNHPRFRVILLGTGVAGLWTLLAAPGADAVAADANATDSSNDQALLEPDLFSPGLRTIGTFEGAALLAAPHPLLLHNTGQNFRMDGIRSGYKTASATKQLRIEAASLPDAALAKWIADL
jgi:hypothetical protein